MFELSQVMHVLGFDPHAFAHFRDERKRRRGQVTLFSFPMKHGPNKVNFYQVCVISQSNATAMFFSIAGDGAGYG